MPIEKAIITAMRSEDLTAETMRAVMQEVMQGQVPEVQMAAWLVALHMKGESATELAAAAQTMRDLALPFPQAGTHQPLLDTCGTGGDGSGLFNVSTAAALVIASMGLCVAKHGNRSASSKCGSADVLEAAGIAIQLPTTDAAICLEQIKICFLFAPMYHPAMRHIAGVRKMLKARTMFNLLGPLANPAHPAYQLLGVYDPRWLEPFASVLIQLGVQRGMVIHSTDGLDELSICAPSRALCWDESGVWHHALIDPVPLRLAHPSLAPLQVRDVNESLRLLYRVLSGEDQGAPRDMVALNSAAAIQLAGLAPDLPTAVELAIQQLQSAKPAALLDRWAALSRKLNHEHQS